MGALERWAVERRGLVRTEQALSAGLSGAMLSRRVDSGQWQHLYRGVYLTRPGPIDWYTQTAAAALACDGAAAGPCGAHIWGADAFEEQPPIQVISAKRRRRVEAKFEVVEAKWLRPEHVTLRSGVPVLQPFWLLADLGQHVARDEVEAAMDYFIRKRFVTWESLEEIAHSPELRKRTGAKRLRELLSLRTQRQHTDSLLETRGLQLLRNAGLGEPVLQFPIAVGRGVTIHADLAYPGANLLIETVGKKAHRSEVWQYDRDCRRLNAVNLLTERFVLLHYTWHQVLHEPETLVADVAKVLGKPLQEGFRLLDRPGGRPALYVAH